MIIYQGFADGLRELDNEVVSDLQVQTPVGRAYKKGDRVYAGVSGVHFRSVFEGEYEHLALLNKFKRRAAWRAPEPFIYAGAAGLLNLSYIAATRPAAAILYDVNFVQKVFWDEVFKAMAEYETVNEFKAFLMEKCESAITERLAGKFNWCAKDEKNDGVCPPSIAGRLCVEGNSALRPDFNGSSYATTAKELLTLGEHSAGADSFWMRQGYDHLHSLAKHDAIGAVTLDVNDQIACKQLKDYLEDPHVNALSFDSKNAVVQQEEIGGAKIGLLYVSNLLDFIKEGTDWTGRDLADSDASVETARENFKMLLSPKARVIGAWGYENWNPSWVTSFKNRALQTFGL